MKKRKAIGPVNLLLLVSAVGLLLFSGIGGARAAMNYVSEQAALRIESGDIDVELRENGKKVPDGTLLSGMEEAIQPGRAYEEELTVHNSGDQDEYVRVTLYRCWTVGRKRQTTPEEVPEIIDIDDEEVPLAGADAVNTEEPAADEKKGSPILPVLAVLTVAAAAAAGVIWWRYKSNPLEYVKARMKKKDHSDDTDN